MKRFCLLLALTMVTVPAAAYAQAPADDYADGPNINEAGQATPAQYDLDLVDTSAATIQNPIVAGSGPENTLCPTRGGVTYGKTVWFYFWASVRGIAAVEAGPFDAVVAIVPQNTGSPFDPIWSQGACFDDPSRLTNEFGALEVTGGRWYAVQIGGYAGEGAVDPNLAASGNLETRFQFFPDRDGDGVFDSVDSCVNTPGSLANGCPRPPPRPNADGDAAFDDGPDKCVGENASARDSNRNGCLDLATFSPNWNFDPGPYFVRRRGKIKLLGIKVQSLGLSDLPPRASVRVGCKPSKACASLRKLASNAGRVNFRKLRGKKLVAGVQVIVRITKSGYVGSWRRYRIGKNKFSSPRNSKDRGCLQLGSDRLRRVGSCSTLR